MLYGTTYWTIRKQRMYKMGVVKIRGLKWMYSNRRKEEIRNEIAHKKNKAYTD